ncbi:hypothetical protein HMPREF0970_01326, partial [Schaalia odontolytica F0309]
RRPRAHQAARPDTARGAQASNREHSKQNPRNTTKSARSNTGIHSFTATCRKVIWEI